MTYFVLTTRWTRDLSPPATWIGTWPYFDPIGSYSQRVNASPFHFIWVVRRIVANTIQATARTRYHARAAAGGAS